MYNILLVEDEPIIVSGVKFLIDWEKYDSRIIGVASNGQEAIDLIEEYLPDIVICDINIPVLSGIDVLQIISEKYPNIVFIILTNHEEFSLAQQCLRLKASDYLLKTNLLPDTLSTTLQNAINERDKRQKLHRVDLVDNYLASNKSLILADHLKILLTSKEDQLLNESYEVCYKNNLLDAYYLIKVLLDFSDIPNLSTFTELDKKRIYECVQEILTKVTKIFFKSFFFVPLDHRTFYIFIYDCTNLTPETFNKFFTKCSNSSFNITQTHLSMLISTLGNHFRSLHTLKEQIHAIEAYYYYTPDPIIFYDQIFSASIKPNSLEPQVFLKQLPHLLIHKDFEGIEQLFNELIGYLESTPHSKEDGIHCCIQLYTSFINVLSSFNTPDLYKEFFNTCSISTTELTSILSFKELILWTETLKKSILTFMSINLNSSHNDIIELAKHYIGLHIFEKITLTDVAEAINVSSGYLSSIFKKQEQQSFVDYINKTKITKACDLLKEQNTLIYEISYQLGFENAYYFSKVFKKYTSLTPKEYQKKMLSLMYNSPTQS